MIWNSIFLAGLKYRDLAIGELLLFGIARAGWAGNPSMAAIRK